MQSTQKLALKIVLGAVLAPTTLLILAHGQQEVSPSWFDPRAVDNTVEQATPEKPAQQKSEQKKLVRNANAPVHSQKRVQKQARKQTVTGTEQGEEIAQKQSSIRHDN